MRTLFNATSQSYSILTLISATDIDKLITEKGLENNIWVTNIIHDCIKKIMLLHIYKEILYNGKVIQTFNPI